MFSHGVGGEVSRGGVVFTLGCTDSALSRYIWHCCRCNLRHKLPVYRSTHLARPRVSSFHVSDAALAAAACTFHGSLVRVRKQRHPGLGCRSCIELARVRTIRVRINTSQVRVFRPSVVRMRLDDFQSAISQVEASSSCSQIILTLGEEPKSLGR